jgi:tagaturonate reductase
MTLSGALKLRAKELAGAVREPFPIAMFFLAAHVVTPLIVFLVCSLVFKGDGDTISGYILLFSVPTAVSGFMWVSIYKGDGALSLTLILLDTLLAPVLVPGTVSLLIGTKVSLDMSGIAFSLVLMVVIPTIIGVTVNETSKGKIPAVVSPYLNPIAKICLILVIAANASAVSIRPDNPKVWIIGFFCIIFTIAGFLLAKLASIIRIGGKLSYEKSVSLFFAASLRNISAATTIAVEFFPAAAALPCLLGIVFQQSLAALMGRVLLKKGREQVIGEEGNR